MVWQPAIYFQQRRTVNCGFSWIAWTHYGQARPKGLRVKLVGYFCKIHFLWFVIKSSERGLNTFFLSQWLQRFGQFLILLSQHNASS